MGTVLPVLAPRRLRQAHLHSRQCSRAHKYIPQATLRGAGFVLQQRCRVHTLAAASRADVYGMTLPETPREWESPSRTPEGIPSSPPEYQPPQEPGQMPGTVPEYTPPDQPNPSRDPPMRPLPPDEDPQPPETDPEPQVPDPERDDPMRNPDKRREETNNPAPVQPGRVLPPDEGAARPVAGPAPPPEDEPEVSAAPPSKARDRELPEDEGTPPAASTSGRPVPPAQEEARQQPSGSRASKYSQDKLKEWNDTYGIPEHLYFEHPTSQAVPWAVLKDPSGHTFHISLNGANIVSWKNALGTDLLHIREDTPTDGVQPIWGGIPIQFPQVGKPDGLVKRAGAALADVPADGFLNSMIFEPRHSGLAPNWVSVSFGVESDADTQALWPHPFQILYTVSVRSPTNDDNRTQLRCVLQILNTGQKNMTFTAGLQPHFSITSPEDTQIYGLGGNYFIDLFQPEPLLGIFAPEELQLGDTPMDYVITNAATESQVALHTGGDADPALLIVNGQGFKDLSLWHPLQLFGASKDFGEDFVALGPTTVARPVTLKPGRKWAGELMLLECDRITDDMREANFEAGPAVGMPRDEWLAREGLTREDLEDSEEEEEEGEDGDQDEDEDDEEYEDDEEAAELAMVA